MNQDIAKLLALTVFQSSSQISGIIPLLKENCSEDEYKPYLVSIASISAEINFQILNKIFAEHPEIKKEFDEKIKKYGRAF
jgi:hypothetical protein